MRAHRPIMIAGLAAALLLAGAAGALAQEAGSTVAADPRLETRTYTFEGTGAEVPYALFVPSSYDPSRAWPVIVGLHGFGRPYDWIMSYDGYVDMAERDGYILVTPKGYHPRAWYGSRGPGIPTLRGSDDDPATLPANLGALSEQDVMNVLRLVTEEFNVDPDRIYLWGHSMGGAGTYHLAAKFPHVWAALAVAAPAPGVSPDQLTPFRHIPILVLQGDQDQAVPVTRTREWVARMRELGMEHVYIEIEGGDHSAFINADRGMISKLYSFFDIVRRTERPETD
ncbi:MAG: prolyl oligopeptidase family serine peptidase [Acidobacteria bacterium]|nr:prolyl oligopeptidase family serine peptidase [Acidobacteriota bacterium]